MLVELGTSDPIGKVANNRPHVVYVSIPDGYSFDPEINTEDFRSHLQSTLRNPSSPRYGITNFPNAEAAHTLTHPNGAWPALSRTDPLWVKSDNTGMQRFLSEYYQCPEGYPSNLEGDYWRKVGLKVLAPGVGFTAVNSPQNLLTNVGVLLASQNISGGQIGASGTGTAAASTTFTSASTWTTNQWAGYRIYVTNSSGSTVWGNVISNTNASGASVATVDGWYPVLVTTSGANGTTPASGYYWFIPDGGSTSAWWMGITTTNITPAVTDTSLSGEATTNGMSRKLASVGTITPSSGSASFTVSTTFTYSGSGATTFYAMGLFPSAVKTDTTDTLAWETSFSGSFTVTNSGDTATVTDTITTS